MGTHAEAKHTRVPLGCRDLCGTDQQASDTSPPEGLTDFDVLQFRRIREREVRVADRFALQPGNEIVTVTLVETGETEDPADHVDLGIVEGTNFRSLRHAESIAQWSSPGELVP